MLDCLAEIGQARTETTAANHEENKYRQIFRLREVHFLAFFILIYVGVEVTLGGNSFSLLECSYLLSTLLPGWTVTYILNVRGGGKNSGYVSSGFFGGKSIKLRLKLVSNYLYTGLTLGRVGLLWVNKKIGERNAIFVYTAISIG